MLVRRRHRGREVARGLPRGGALPGPRRRHRVAGDGHLAERVAAGRLPEPAGRLPEPAGGLAEPAGRLTEGVAGRGVADRRVVVRRQGRVAAHARRGRRRGVGPAVRTPHDGSLPP
ncbi:hypothetical protein ETD96_38020 [Actinomadura geliboluensis]|uniref:Uncharacterized protein n=1 Tax=Actinomadura geliboluensis TaxID=882440 RepID=A0A5S4GP78_9ACTN|nr:hypothetical protein ETD96_38020 [Actinomadura geliboluensis]